MDPRDARRERRREQVRDDILQAARGVVLHQGLSGLTLSAVAREVQLTKAALYYYFTSKEALVFELLYASLAAHAEVVGGAIARAASGSEALEMLIRTSAAHYAGRHDDLRLAYLVPQVGRAGLSRSDPGMLARIRPFNDRLYGATAEKIAADQRAGRAPPHLDGRRLAFLAHVAVLGMLVVEGLVELTDHVPLIHGHDAMVDELVRTFTARLVAPG